MIIRKSIGLFMQPSLCLVNKILLNKVHEKRIINLLILKIGQEDKVER